MSLINSTTIISSTDSVINFLNNLASTIDHWCLILTVPLGIALNILSIGIYARLDMPKSNMSFLYINLSVWNAFVLIYYFFVMDSKSLMGYDLVKISEIGCKMIVFIR
jgi:hypothetical protein